MYSLTTMDVDQESLRQEWAGHWERCSSRTAQSKKVAVGSRLQEAYENLT
jgi:hypothetical protein